MIIIIQYNNNNNNNFYYLSLVPISTTWTRNEYFKNVINCTKIYYLMFDIFFRLPTID